MHAKADVVTVDSDLVTGAIRRSTGSNVACAIYSNHSYCIMIVSCNPGRAPCAVMSNNLCATSICIVYVSWSIGATRLCGLWSNMTPEVGLTFGISPACYHQQALQEQCCISRIDRVCSCSCTGDWGKPLQVDQDSQQGRVLPGVKCIAAGRRSQICE